MAIHLLLAGAGPGVAGPTGALMVETNGRTLALFAVVGVTMGLFGTRGWLRELMKSMVGSGMLSS